MKMPTLMFARSIATLLATGTALALTACATVTTQPQKTGTASASPGTVTVTEEDLKRTGRTEPGDALRASSPIFH